MSESKSRKKRSPKRVLALPDLEHAKSRAEQPDVYQRPANLRPRVREFVGWYCSEPRLALNRTVVLRYRFTSNNANMRRPRSIFGSPGSGGSRTQLGEEDGGRVDDRSGDHAGPSVPSDQ
jgi:hypothetical protein